MKILLLYTYNKGYLSGFFTEVAELLVAEGNEVFCFSLKTKKQTFKQNKITFHVGIKGGYINNYRQIYAYIKKTKPDVVLSNFSYVNPALLFGRWFGVKRNIVWFHSLNEQMEATWSNIFIKALFLKLANTVIANSYLTKTQLSSVYKVSSKKIKVLPFWSTIAEQQITVTGTPNYLKNNKLAIGCPGRMAAHKNQRIVLEAAAKLKKETTIDFHVYFAGDGEEFLNLQALTKTLKIENEVSFLKHLSAEDMALFYKSMDVIILPSLHEAFGLVFIEAISLNIPILVSKSFGALSFIDKEKVNCNKFSFNPNSAEELELKMIENLKNYNYPEDYFRNLYNNYFSKESIYNQFKLLLNL